ncbi:hypothetical protein D3C85_1364050 [compost metagenome]
MGAVGRIDLQPHRLRVLLQQGAHALGQPVRILAHVRRGHRVERFLAHVGVPAAVTRLELLQRRTEVRAALPLGNRTVRITGTLGTQRGEFLAKPGRFGLADLGKSHLGAQDCASGQARRQHIAVDLAHPIVSLVIVVSQKLYCAEKER